MTSVKDVLKEKGRAAWHVDADATMEEALLLMAEKNVGALLVYESGRLVGIVSERDYARQSVVVARTPRETEVRKIMSKDLLTVSEGDSIGKCMELISGARVRHLPVLAGDRVVGIISIGDVVNAVMREHRLIIKHLEGYITGQR